MPLGPGGLSTAASPTGSNPDRWRPTAAKARIVSTRWVGSWGVGQDESFTATVRVARSTKTIWPWMPRAQQDVAGRSGDEPELVAVPAARQDRFRVGGGERTADVRVDVPGLLQPAFGHDVSMSDPAVVEQHLAEAGQVASRSADSTVVHRGPESITGDLGVVLCAHRRPDEGGHQVGHPHAGGPLAHPAENVGIRRTVDERAAVRPLADSEVR